MYHPGIAAIGSSMTFDRPIRELRLVSAPADAPSPAGEWCPRTFVLTDIVGSVALWERATDQMSSAVARHEALIRREITAAGGTLVRARGEGDSTFAVFVRPLDAIAAVAAIQDVLAAEPWPPLTPVRVRAGVHTGEAEGRDGDWYGPTVNRAARLRCLATGAQTLVSGVTAGLVADRMPAALRLTYRGRRHLRGIARPEDVWELTPASMPPRQRRRSRRRTLAGAGRLPA